MFSLPAGSAFCKLQQGLLLSDSVPSLVAVPSIFILFHLLPWLYDYYGIRKVPGPFLAKFSDLWLAFTAMGGHRSDVVHQLHHKHGTMVRLAPNHVSIADPEALSIIYGHGNGSIKSPFYDAFVAIRRSIFNTRDRGDHTRKRKIVSNMFSPKSVLELEPHLQRHISNLVKQWDRLCVYSLKGSSGPEGNGWHGERGYLFLDVHPWANYLSFDLISDLSFGTSFGMLTTARDVTQIPRDHDHVMKVYGDKGAKVEVREIPAIKTINGRGKYCATMGCFPGYWHPIMRLFPWFRRGSIDDLNLTGIAVMAIMKRLSSNKDDRVDLLSKLRQGKDSKGNLMCKEEVTAEALTFMTAGSDTMSNSTCSIIYHLACNQSAQRKLQVYLDENLGAEELSVVGAAQVKNLSYLDACIKEGLRVHSTSSLGLPRVVPEGGRYISGHFFPAGAIVSVPSYTIHRDKKIWGEDAEKYRPERWEEMDQKATQCAFNPFSLGPRGCVGKNLAMLELRMIIASLIKRYELVLADPYQSLETEEGFLRKPLMCKVGIRRRETSHASSMI